jgi:hypothetical protein
MRIWSAALPVRPHASPPPFPSPLAPLILNLLTSAPSVRRRNASTVMSPYTDHRLLRSQADRTPAGSARPCRPRWCGPGRRGGRQLGAARTGEPTVFREGGRGSEPWVAKQDGLGRGSGGGGVDGVPSPPTTTPPLVSPTACTSGTLADPAGTISASAMPSPLPRPSPHPAPLPKLLALTPSLTPPCMVTVAHLRSLRIRNVTQPLPQPSKLQEGARHDPVFSGQKRVAEAQVARSVAHAEAARSERGSGDGRGGGISSGGRVKSELRSRK